MPFINAKTNVALSDEQKLSLKTKLTNSITAIPGKTPAYLMCAVEDNISMMFRGDEKTPVAFVDVKLLCRNVGDDSMKPHYTALTAEICRIMNEEIGVSGDRCYVKFEEVRYWGMDSFMF